MLMRPARRSFVAAALLAVSMVCLIVGPAYLYADYGFWAQGFHWSNAFDISDAHGSTPATAAEIVFAGAGFTSAGVCCLVGGIAVYGLIPSKASAEPNAASE